jgi:ADP-ribose pyrophosphatase YjhB (NUDIX family)
MHQDVRHYQEEGRVNPAESSERLTAAEYGRALDHLVTTCVDIVLTYQDQVLLARRKTYPRRSWWIIGGRMIAGESPLQAVQRKVALEASLQELAPERFHYLAAYSTCFATREQAPSHNGLHSVNLTYVLELSAAELPHVMLDPQEYGEWQWLTRAQIQVLIQPQTVLDQALLQILQDLECRNRL